MTASPPRLTTLDALRGIAALSVCWCHFTNGNDNFLPDCALRSSGEYGWLGVQIFFVISGFIIPYTLHRSGYQISDYGTFILKRVIRLDPPYLFTILVVIGLEYASLATPGFRGPPFHFSIIQTLLHLGYLNVFFEYYPWYNPVFWTLAIEVQYYLLVGLLFPAIASRSLVTRLCAFGCLAGLAFSNDAIRFVFHWLFLFMLGMAAFQLHAGIYQRRQFFLWILLLGLGSWYVNGGVIAVTGMATALLVGLFEAGLKPKMLFFGQISYSLYLLNCPVGGRVINLSTRFVHSMPGKFGACLAAMAITTAAAWLMYRYVERPAQQWSSKLRYRKKPVVASGFAEPAPVLIEPKPVDPTPSA